MAISCCNTILARLFPKIISVSALGFFDGGTLLILTNGFAKKTQKTPPQEIALAIRRKNDYLARRKKP